MDRVFRIKQLGIERISGECAEKLLVAA